MLVRRRQSVMTSPFKAMSGLQAAVGSFSSVRAVEDPRSWTLKWARQPQHTAFAGLRSRRLRRAVLCNVLDHLCISALLRAGGAPRAGTRLAPKPPVHSPAPPANAGPALSSRSRSRSCALRARARARRAPNSDVPRAKSRSSMRSAAATPAASPACLEERRASPTARRGPRRADGLCDLAASRALREPTRACALCLSTRASRASSARAPRVAAAAAAAPRAPAGAARRAGRSRRAADRRARRPTRERRRRRRPRSPRSERRCSTAVLASAATTGSQAYLSYH